MVTARYARLASADWHDANRAQDRFAATNGPLSGAVPFSREGTSSMKLFIARDMKNTSRL
jgi:hypothetical protein